MLLALTGATGFIGQHLLRELPKRGYRLRVLLRQPSSIPMPCASAVIGDLARPRNMSAALEGVDAVIHSAGFTHGMSGIHRCFPITSIVPNACRAITSSITITGVVPIRS